MQTVFFTVDDEGIFRINVSYHISHTLQISISFFALGFVRSEIPPLPAAVMPFRLFPTVSLRNNAIQITDWCLCHFRFEWQAYSVPAYESNQRYLEERDSEENGSN